MNTPSDRNDMLDPRDDQAADIELVVSYLNDQLDPERVKIVAQRLADDEAFRRFAAPLILAWRAETEAQEVPLPPGDLEKDWEAFTRKARFVHQRRKARIRGWIIFGSVVFTLMLGWIVLHDVVLDQFGKMLMDTQMSVIPDSGGKWIKLVDGTEVQLSPMTRFKGAHTLVGGIQFGVLEHGRAHFRRDSRPSRPDEPPSGFFVLPGRATIGVDGAEFRVNVHRDTIDVDVIDRGRPVPPDSLSESVVILSGKGERVRLYPGQSGRLLKSGKVLDYPRPPKETKP